MKGHVPSPPDAIDRHLTGVQQVSLISSPAQSEDGWVFKQEQQVLTCTPTPLLDQGFLPGQGLGIFNQTKVNAVKVHGQHLERISKTTNHVTLSVAKGLKRLDSSLRSE